MAGEEVKLFAAWPSPFTHRVKCVLKLKGIQYEYVEEHLFNKSPLLLKYNPIHKKVPVFVHNGRPLAESLVIIDYIDETWKQNPILPEDPYERAMARFWAKFAEEKFTEVIKRALLLEGEDLEKELEQARDALEILEGELKGKKFFGGDSIGYLDIVLGWTSIWLEAIEATCFKVFEAPKYPFLAKWMENILELPLIEENLPPKDNLVTFFQIYRQAARCRPSRLATKARALSSL